MRPSCESTKPRTRAHLRERGATIVEYSLLVAAVVVVSLGAIQNLQDNSEAEVANEFDCVSERPPPPTCQKRAVTTTTSTTISATTSTTAPVETTTTTEVSTTTTTVATTTTLPGATTTTAAPAVTTAVWSDSGVSTSPRGSSWSARSRLAIRNAADQDIIGAVVEVEMVDTKNNSSSNDDTVLSSYTCTMRSSGRCETAGDESRPYITVPGSVQEVRFRVKSVSTNPPSATPTEQSSRLDEPDND